MRPKSQEPMCVALQFAKDFHLLYPHRSSQNILTSGQGTDGNLICRNGDTSGARVSDPSTITQSRRTGTESLVVQLLPNQGACLTSHGL